MSAATQPGQTPHYFVPAPSQYPVLVATGMFFVILGAGQWVNGNGLFAWVLLFGLLMWAFVMQGWFRQAIHESESGLYGDKIDVSFRWSMSWFIFSEVMFFAAFFGALYWARAHSVPNLGSLENALLEFPGCAVVISHDRWFLDRVATHILAWEGDEENPAKWYWFEGNFESYEKNKLDRLGQEAARPHRVTYRKLKRDD